MRHRVRFKDHRGYVACLLLLSLLVGACGTTATATPLPTTTPQSTATAVPTATPVPTPTPIPLAEWVEEGDALLKESDVPGAEAAYQRAIEADPSYAPAYMGLSALYYWQTGREDEGLEAAETAVELAPDSAAAHAALALAREARFAPEDAVTAAEQAVELDEESAAAQAALAQAYLQDRQYEAALQAAVEAISLDPELAEGYYALGVCYSSMSEFARARAAFAQTIALEPQFAPWHVSLGNLWSWAAEYERADESFQRALELVPDLVSALLGASDISIGRKEYEEARDQIENVIDLIPEAPQGYVAMGYLGLEQGETEEALAQFRQALEKRDEYWPATFGVARVHLDEYECDSATRQAQELMALQPRFAGGRLAMGYAKLCDGDVSKALEYLRKAQELEPYGVSPQLGLGYAYAAQDRWDEALSALVQALRFSASGTEAHNALGDIFSWQGELEQAMAEHRLALQRDPKSAEAHVSLSNLLFMSDRDRESQDHAEQALAVDETDPDAQRLLGAALLSQGLPQDAVEVLEQLVEEEPEDTFGHFFLALVYRDVGRYADAKKEMETYLALNPSDPDRARIAQLVEALGQGYVMSEDKAIADLAELLEERFDIEADIRIEEDEAKVRTMLVSFDADPEKDQREQVYQMAMPIGLGALYVQRLEPPVGNGILVQLEEDDEPLYSLRLGLKEIKEWWVGLISDSELDSVLEYSRMVLPEDPTPLEEIETGLAETRELEAQAEVPYKTLTEEGLELYLTDSMDAEAREAMEASDDLLTLLGVIEPDADLEQLMLDLYQEQVSGFYSMEEKAFYTIEDEEQTATDQMVIAHEYVHALQDQTFGLRPEGEEDWDSDRRRAFDALVEGDATLAMLLYASDHIGIFDLLQAQSAAGGFESEVYDASPVFIQEIEMFPYRQGLQFVIDLHDSGGWAAVDEAYEDPPQSTEQILHPDRYRQEDAPQQVSLPDVARQLGGDWEEIENDVLGELGLRLALAQHMGPGAASLAAEGWAGDRYTLLDQGKVGPNLLVLRTYWDDQDEADEFWSLFAVCMNHREGYLEEVEQLTGEIDSRWWFSDEHWVRVERHDRYVEVIIGPDAGIVEEAASALEE